jgi:glycosyltransferase involved in cell wall biosynthesis
MSRSAASRLATAYGVDARRLDIIPHGVPNLPLVEPETVKASLGVAGRRVILSFGLLGPGKGYELALEALPSVVAKNPTACYVVVGVTHPDLIRVELTRWLEAADVFVTPYPKLDQIVSGTLSYAMGAGRAIVSSPYTYAAELLADDRGVLVEPRSATALARALNRVLGDDELRASLGRRAYAHSRQMVWPAVGARYRTVFERAVGKVAPPVLVGSLAAMNA